MASEAAAANQYGLITRERADSVDLLGQLILNQKEAIILCGAEGIGKTTLLTTFKSQRENIWVICLLQGLKTLSFEQIQTQLVSTIQHYNPELANHDLPSALSFCEQQQRKTVLMIDDAAHLTAGLITTLTEYALHNPLLRIVFAFTREQLHQKNRTDRVVDDCYFMELPALTKSQTAAFLHDLSVFPQADDDVQKIDDKLLNKLYQRSAGIPGKIITELPLLTELSSKKSFSPLKSVLIISIILMSAGLFYVNNLSRQSIVSALPHGNSPSNIPALRNTTASKAVFPRQSVKTIAKPSVLNTPPLEAELNKQVIQQDADEQWILQQAADHYTLQLMALSKRQALLNIAKKHHNLEAALKILRITNRNQEKYVFLYGSFADTKTAYAAVDSLPVEFRDAFPRLFATLQKEIKNRPLLLPKTQSSKQ